MSKSVMIVAGESSGELYGALLTGKLKSLWPDVEVTGKGGERMRRAGVKTFEGIVSSFGFTEAFSTLSAVRAAMERTIKRIKDERPDVLVLIDYPDFNFPVGRAAKEAGIRVLYYVSPQVWAWRPGRVRKMPGIADRIAVLLPFEEGIYRAVGMPCEFVGHPIMDEISLLPGGRTEIKTGLGLDPKRPSIALLPGSRKHELNKLLPVMHQVVRRMKEEYPDYQYIVPLAPNIDLKAFEPQIEALEGDGVAFTREGAIGVLASADAAVIASGTAALQAAFLGTPHVVVYKVFPLTYLLGRLLVVNVKYISLPNLLMDKTVVQEMLQSRANPGEIVKELRRIIDDSGYRREMSANFESIKGLFYGKRPSMRVAEIIGEMAEWTA